MRKYNLEFSGTAPWVTVGTRLFPCLKHFQSKAGGNLGALGRVGPTLDPRMLT